MQQINLTRHKHLVVCGGALVSAHLRADTAQSVAERVGGVVGAPPSEDDVCLAIGQAVQIVDGIVRPNGGGGSGPIKPN